MELRMITERTGVFLASQWIPFYRLDDQTIVLLDSGYETPDRAPLEALLEKRGLRVRAVLGSHIHIDHSGNHRYFQQRGAEIILPLIEAAVAQSPTAAKLAFFLSSPGQIDTFFHSMLVQADRVILPGETEVEIEGARFSIVPLPGHTAGHSGIITPDGICYVGDGLMSEETMKRAKLPTCLSYQTDLESKRRLAGLSCKGYLLAHSGFYEHIGALVDQNICALEEKAREIAALVEDGMTMDALSAAAWAHLGMRTKRPERIAMYRRNLHCVVEYLCDIGELEQVFDGGVTRYQRRR